MPPLLPVLVCAAVSGEPHRGVGARPPGRPRRLAGAVQPPGPPSQQSAAGVHSMCGRQVLGCLALALAAAQIGAARKLCMLPTCPHACPPTQVLLDTPAALPRCYRVLVSLRLREQQAARRATLQLHSWSAARLVVTACHAPVPAAGAAGGVRASGPHPHVPPSRRVRPARWAVCVGWAPCHPRQRKATTPRQLPATRCLHPSSHPGRLSPILPPWPLPSHPPTGPSGEQRWVYTLRLQLEDATGQLDAHVFGPDGE